LVGLAAGEELTMAVASNEWFYVMYWTPNGWVPLSPGWFQGTAMCQAVGKTFANTDTVAVFSWTRKQWDAVGTKLAVMNLCW
jgi:hypothetical protein